LAEAFPYLILDARYERVREAGVITSQAVLIAIWIDWDGRRQVLAVELANRESRSDARHAKAALSLQINKPDANDAFGLAQVGRTGGTGRSR
jgi:hypothetical protein